MGDSATSHHLPALLRTALGWVPAADRPVAARMTVLLQSGYGEREAARELDLTWEELSGLKATLRVGMIESLRGDGYADSEIQPYLGVSSAVVNDHRASAADLAPTLQALFSEGVLP